VNLFDAKTWAEVREVQPHEGVELTSLAYSPSGGFLALADENGGVVLAAAGVEETQAAIPLGDDEAISSLAATTSPSGEAWLAAANGTGRFRLMRGATAEVVSEMNDGGQVHALAFSSGGLLASGGGGGVVVREAGGEQKVSSLELTGAASRGKEFSTQLVPSHPTVH
ncbi:MAG: hypothetical protein SGPRY_002988, partial [Prymnesium sp.]